jgi:sigma-B regulation protein RsbU (phosphoserine phosphatase)
VNRDESSRAPGGRRAAPIPASELASLLLDSTGEGIYGVDLEGDCIFVNPAGQRILGFDSQEELIGRHMHNLVHHTRLDGTPYPVEECRIYQALHDLEGTHVEDEIMFRGDGDSFPAEYWSYPVIRDGELMGSVVTFVDITERVRQAEELRTSSERISLLLQSTGEGIYGVDVEGLCTFINPAGVELLGFEEVDELIGRHMHNLVHHTRLDGTPYPVEECRIYQALHDLEGTHVEDEIMFRGDGDSFPAEYWSYPVIRDGELVGSVVTFIDITERREIERRLQEAKERMEDELNIGREIQMSMLPVDFPAFPDRDDFNIHAMLEPAREVGGDLYDFFLIDEDRLCFLVGDVSDKGVPAALFMAVTKTLIKSHAIHDVSVRTIMASVNDALMENNESSMFVTLFVAILDTRTGQMRYTNAGHNPPFVKRADGRVIKLDDRHGPVAGAIVGVDYGSSSMDLGRGDRVILYTDGVSEAMDQDHTQYTEVALEALITHTELGPPEDVVMMVEAAVSQHRGEAEQSDDITVLALEYLGMEHPRSALTVGARLDAIPGVLDEYDAFAMANGLPIGVSRRVRLALDDLLNNIATYAYEDEGQHEVDIAIELWPTRLVITISDSGVPFDPFSVNAPDVRASLEERDLGGLGIHLVRTVMDEVDYSRRAGRNVVTVTKRLEPPEIPA